jgi:hypothetical protein
MRYTIQLHTESGCFAAPRGIDVRHCSGQADIRWHLDNWADTVSRYSEEPVEVLVWRGTLEDVTDVYPDWIATLGPKGGMHLNPA